MYVSQEVCLPIPEGSGKLACYLTGLHAETGRERETSERTNSEQNNRERRSDLCVCVWRGEGGRPWILAAATSVSAAVLMIFLFLFTAAEIKLDKRPGESQAVCSLGGKYGNALNVHPGRSESGTRKQHNWSSSCESRH